MSLEYKMVQIPKEVIANIGNSDTAASEYLQEIVNSLAEQGWIFQRMDQMNVNVNQGFLSIFGGPNIEICQVMTFYRERDSSAPSFLDEARKVESEVPVGYRIHKVVWGYAGPKLEPSATILPDSMILVKGVWMPIHESKQTELKPGDILAIKNYPRRQT